MKIVERTTICPFCRDRLPLATALCDDFDAPQAGDICLCFTCGEPSMFDDTPDGAHRPTRSERREINSDPDIIEARRAWRQVRQ